MGDPLAEGEWRILYDEMKLMAGDVTEAAASRIQWLREAMGLAEVESGDGPVPTSPPELPTDQLI